jgi:hypothetical protein
MTLWNCIQLNYSNVAHLSNQFKKTLVLPDPFFQAIKDKEKQIDGL